MDINNSTVKIKINPISHWVADHIKQQDIVIVGAGIVGITAAIAAKSQFPSKEVIIIDKGTGYMGASTRNAGFACFGSPSELLGDIEINGEAKALETLAMRWQGLQMLKGLVPKTDMQYLDNGGYEIFSDEILQQKCSHNISYLNDLICDIVKEKHTYAEVETPLGKGILNKLEGTLHPAKMMSFLMGKALQMGVKTLFQTEVLDIDTENQTLTTDKGSIYYKQCILATNAWTAKIFPDMDIKPARNHVLVTQPLANCPIKGAYHMEEGYIYFRNIENRILIGGARNLASNEETTYDMHMPNVSIINRLLEVLSKDILKGESFEIAHAWTGLLGVGTDKMPIIKQHAPNCFLAVKMGGMGVAIGSYVGNEVANLLVDIT